MRDQRVKGEAIEGNVDQAAPDQAGSGEANLAKAPSPPTRVWVTGLLVLGLVSVLSLVAIALEDNQTRNDIVSNAWIAAALASGFAVLAMLCHFIASRKTFDTGIKRTLAFLALPTLIAALAGISFAVSSDEAFSGFIELGLIVFVTAGVVLGGAALALQRFTPFGKGALAGFLPLASWTGIAALALSTASEDTLKQTSAQLARQGFVECDEADYEPADVEKAIKRFQASLGEEETGRLTTGQHSALANAEPRTRFTVGGDSPDFETLDTALRRACAMKGVLSVELAPGEYIFPVDERYPDWEQATDSAFINYGDDDLALTIKGAGPEATRIASFTQVKLGRGDTLSDVTLVERRAPQPEDVVQSAIDEVAAVGEADAHSVILHGPDAALRNVVIELLKDSARYEVIAAKPLPGARVQIDRVTVTSPDAYALAVSNGPDPREAQIDAGEALDARSVEDEQKKGRTGEVIVTNSRFTGGANYAAISAKDAVRLSLTDSAVRGHWALHAQGTARVTLNDVSLSAAGRDGLYLTGNSGVTMQGGRIARSGSTVCASVEGESNLRLRKVDLSECSGGKYYAFQIRDSASADVKDSPGVRNSDFYKASQTSQLAFKPVVEDTPVTGLLAGLGGSGPADGLGRRGGTGRPVGGGHRAWLLSNYLNPMANKATDCAFVAKSNQALLPAANLASTLCLFNKKMCDSRDETIREVLADQRQCWADLEREHAERLGPALRHRETCPNLSRAISRFSQNWVKGATRATSVVDANGNRPDPIARTRRFNKRSSDAFLELMSETDC